MKNLFIQRSVKKDISPQNLRKNIKGMLGILMSGGLEVLDKPLNINERNTWSDSWHQNGDWTYRISICLPITALKQFQRIKIFEMKEGSSYSDWGVSHKEIEKPLTESEMGFYTRMEIPEDLLDKLIPYMIVFGGEINKNEDEPLSPVWIGEKTREILIEAGIEVGRRGIEN